MPRHTAVAAASPPGSPLDHTTCPTALRSRCLRGRGIGRAASRTNRITKEQLRRSRVRRRRMGGPLVESLFGARAGGIADWISSFSRISRASSSSLLGLVLPLVLAQIGNVVKGTGWSGSNLMTLLGEQRQFLQNAPAGLAGVLGRGDQVTQHVDGSDVDTRRRRRDPQGVSAGRSEDRWIHGQQRRRQLQPEAVAGSSECRADADRRPRHRSLRSCGGRLR